MEPGAGTCAVGSGSAAQETKARIYTDCSSALEKIDKLRPAISLIRFLINWSSFLLFFVFIYLLEPPPLSLLPLLTVCCNGYSHLGQVSAFVFPRHLQRGHFCNTWANISPSLFIGPFLPKVYSSYIYLSFSFRPSKVVCFPCKKFTAIYPCSFTALKISNDPTHLRSSDYNSGLDFLGWVVSPSAVSHGLLAGGRNM